MPEKKPTLDWNDWVAAARGMSDEEINKARAEFAKEISDIIRTHPLGPLVAVNGALGGVASVIAVATSDGDNVLLIYYKMLFADLLRQTTQLARTFTATSGKPC